MAKHVKIPVDDVIDRFVELVNRWEREPKFGNELPSWLRVGTPHNENYPDGQALYDWQVRKTDRKEWIDVLEAKLPCPFPPAFRSLVRRYVYPDFTVGPLWILANTGEPLYHEMSEFIVRDKHLNKVLHQHGYQQFARPDGGSYDPICFDTRRKLKGGEYPIVRVEHEAVLCHSRIGKVWEIAPSFLAFVVEVVEKSVSTEQERPP